MNEPEHTDLGRIIAEAVPPLPVPADPVGEVRARVRRMRTHRAVGIGGVAVLTALAVAAVPAVWNPADDPVHPPTAVPPTACEVERLPVPEGTVSSAVTGGDPTGRFLLGWATSYRSDADPETGMPRDEPGQNWTLLWEDGRMTILDLPGGMQASGLVVNSAGTVAGDGRHEDGRLVPFVLEDGAYRELPGGRSYGVADINARGDILGNRGLPAFDDGGPSNPWARRSIPVVWPADDREAVRDLPLPADADPAHRAVGVAIDADGTVVGGIGNPWAVETGGPQTARALVWSPDGTVRELPAPDGSGPDYRSHSADIREGWVLGSVIDAASGDLSITRWHLPSGEIRPGSALVVRGESPVINAQGWLAGSMSAGESHEGDLPIEVPAIEVDGRVIALPEPPEADPSPNDHPAVSFSDDGRIVGGSVHYINGTAINDGPDWPAPGGPHFDAIAVRWTCH